MGITTYNQGFKSGYHYVKGLPSVDKVGAIFWVGKNDTAPDGGITPSDGNIGSPLQPFATLKYAVAQCTQGQGDVIYLYPGHVANVTDADTQIGIDTVGVTVVFLGHGSSRATINCNYVGVGSMALTARSITLINPRFLMSTENALALSIFAGECTVINGECESEDGISSVGALVNVIIVGSNRATRIHGWKYYAGDEAGVQKDSHMLFNEIDNLDLRDIEVKGDFAVSVIGFPIAGKNLKISNCKLNNLNATPSPAIDISASMTGLAKNNDLRVASGTTFVSSVADINWDTRCLGYNTDGKGGTPIAVF